MVHSTWGEWFVRDNVEAADPDSVAIWYLGGNGFVVRTAQTTVYLDPYFGDGSPPRIVRMIPVPMDAADATHCDAVFVTHEHIDHMHPPSYGPLVEGLGATLYAPRAAYEEPAYDGTLRAPPERRRVVERGDRYEVGDLTIHVRGARDPDAIEPVSYIIEHDDGTFFHPGDSRPAPEFATIGEHFDIDVGAVPYGTVGNIYHTEADPPDVYPTDWYNNGNQVVEIASDLRLGRLLPTHWDLWNGVGADPTALAAYADSFEYPLTIEHVSIGDRLTIDRPGVVPMHQHETKG